MRRCERGADEAAAAPAAAPSTISPAETIAAIAFCMVPPYVADWVFSRPARQGKLDGLCRAARSSLSRNIMFQLPCDATPTSAFASLYFLIRSAAPAAVHQP